MSDRHRASAAQTRAADPDLSTWLSANAGSGKTRVLIQRVVRLLFAGTPPQRILCLTFTKAAAAEMQNRLFALLGSWAMLDSSRLLQALLELGVGEPIHQNDLASARRLFAQAIEAPGGLRILTIHSFCSSLLRRFPLEARVSPGFTEIDETTTAILRAEVLEEMADGDCRPLIDGMAMAYRNEDWSRVIDDIGRYRDLFEGGRDLWSIRTALEIPSEFTMERLWRDVLGQDGAAVVSELRPILDAGSAYDVDTSARLAQFRADDPAHQGLLNLEHAFLTKDGRVSSKAGPTKPTRARAPARLMSALDHLIGRVADAQPIRLALQEADRSDALHRFARAFLGRFEAAKAARGWLDFDDLIRLTAALLSDHAVAQWVLYRLDGGIDHILVDEAQDTGPGQWMVIERLADEFASSEGSRGEDRTVFIVGDKKQSIYSFQGADLQTFDRMEHHFQNRYAPRGRWQAVSLDYSFRSSPAILKVVDATFDDRANKGLGGTPEHFAFFGDMPGRVDVWPILTDEPADEERDYFTPAFVPSAERAQIRLAAQIAAQIRDMIAVGTPVKDRGAGFRPAHEGDFLILVRQRQSPLFNAIIRACKAAGLEVAGADRLRLAAEIAVRDLVSLLKFLSLPEDDLSLAAALRSPLFGWSEQQVFDIAAKRPERTYLWQFMRNADSAATDTVSILDDLRDHAEFLRPYDLIERALTRHDMRRRLLERLGPEAEDGIDELLTQALAYEQTDVPNLTGFLLRLEVDAADIKRQTPQGARAIRVMTAHGAKGLEAPVVILPDTLEPRKSTKREVLVGAGKTALWRANSGEAPPVIAKLKDEEVAREQEERMRLLYVAMTRAESWLIVAAAGAAKETDSGWYTLVRAGAVHAGAEQIDVQGVGQVLRVSHGDWPMLPSGMQSVAQPEFDLPDWMAVPAPSLPPAAGPLSPSSLPGSKALPGEGGQDPDFARRYGTLLHLLLEHLPLVAGDSRRAVAEDLLRSLEDPATDAEIARLYADAERIFAAPDLAGIFAADTLAEVEVTGRIPELPGRLLQGTIDRLVIRADRIVVIDFKSNAQVPGSPRDVPDGILRQLAAYVALLEQIYRDRAVEAAVVWTATAQLMPISRDILRSALAATPIP